VFDAHVESTMWCDDIFNNIGEDEGLG